MYVPESPLFLYESNDFEKLEESLELIARINGIKGYKYKVGLIVEKLKLTRPTPSSNLSLINQDQPLKKEGL
jgi:hypothetical protein